jgi:hypothetical protein
MSAPVAQPRHESIWSGSRAASHRQRPGEPLAAARLARFIEEQMA